MSRQQVSSIVLRCQFVLLLGLVAALVSGCSTRNRPIKLGNCGAVPCSDQLQKISYPEILDDNALEETPYAGPPVTLSSFESVQFKDLTLDECIQISLANSKVMQKLGGVVVSSPNAATTLYDQAIVETGPQSVEAALSAFDTQLTSSFNYNRSERRFNNLFFGGGAPSLISNTSNFRLEASKQTASGATVAVRNLTDYNRNSSPANAFGSAYDTVNQVEIRQPLARGAGTLVNRIAGPNAQFGANALLGQFNGVLISRIRSDISLSDFEAAVRNLVRDVESNYWELYNAYRNLDTILEARNSARETWENRKLRLDNEVGRPDDEAQARQQFYTFEAQAQNALAGRANGQLGVLGAERNLRRLMGMPPADGSVIRPSSEPVVAPVAFDWDISQQQAKARRVELRRQKWTIRQREMELIAARQLNKWRVDLVGNYGFRGFGDDLFGSRSRESGSAFEDLTSGDLDDWQVGFEVNGPIGRRAGHLAIRNAELNLTRARTILNEQERQILHDLNAAFTEVDRAFVGMKTSFNARIASQDELEPKRKRVEEGKDQVFFLLDAQQRQANAESAVHRSIADYNLAIMNYHFATGSLLSRFNIRLTEGPWSDNATARASIKAGRLEAGEKCCNDLSPVSAGQYDQVATNTNFVSATGQDWIESESVPASELPTNQVIEESVEEMGLPESGVGSEPSTSLDFDTTRKIRASTLVEKVGRKLNLGRRRR
jgi:outer membrane protein TolC